MASSQALGPGKGSQSRNKLRNQVLYLLVLFLRGKLEGQPVPLTGLIEDSPRDACKLGVAGLNCQLNCSSIGISSLTAIAIPLALISIPWTAIVSVVPARRISTCNVSGNEKRGTR